MSTEPTLWVVVIAAVVGAITSVAVMLLPRPWDVRLVAGLVVLAAAVWLL